MAADDEIDRLAQRRRRPRRSRRSSCRAGRGSAGRPTARHRPGRVRPAGPSTTRCRRRAPRAGPDRPAPRSRQPPGQPIPDHVRPCCLRPRANVDRAQSQPYTSHRRGADARAAAYAAARPGRSGGPVRGRRGTRATRGPPAAPRRTRAGSAAGRGPRSAAALGPGGRGHAPGPDRVGDVAEMQEAGRAPARSGSSSPDRSAVHRGPRQRSRTDSGPVGNVAPRGPARRARRRAVAGLERPRRREEPPVQGQQIGLGHRAFVRHRHAQQDLALALGVADRRATGSGLRLPGLTGETRRARSAAPRSAGRGHRSVAAAAAAQASPNGAARAAISHRRHRTAGRSIRARGGSRARPGRRSTRARCRAGS